MVTEPEMTWKDDLIPPTVNIGDVMCTDGTTMNVDTFVKYYPEHGKFPMGVVFFVDNTGLHGLVVALRDACERQVWSKWNTWGNYSTHKPMVKSLTITTNAITAMSDINGFGNTQKIKQTAEIVGPRDFSYNAPAIYACFYYNHNTLSVGTDSLGWYMPALGELNMLWMNRKESCISLKKLSTINSAITQLSSYGSYAYTAYLSSTLYDDWNMWFFGSGYYRQYHVYDNNFMGGPGFLTRAIYKF